MKIKTFFMINMALNAAFFMLTSQAASFPCTKALTLVEKAICSEKPLSDLDDDLAGAYKKAQANSKDSLTLKNQQLNWLNSRNTCQDSACLIKAYNKRIADLNNHSGSTDQMGNQEISCRKALGKKQSRLLVEQCIQISPATHPPCNDENTCSMIKEEINRGCHYAREASVANTPKFCSNKENL